MGSRAFERTNLLTRPVPDGQALVDIRIGKPRLDRIKHEHLHLRNASTPLFAYRYHRSLSETFQ